MDKRFRIIHLGTADIQGQGGHLFRIVDLEKNREMMFVHGGWGYEFGQAPVTAKGGWD